MASDAPFRFDDGASYEQMMGRWSLRVGERFLDWIDAPAGVRWVDIGCGNGAFTELIATRCAPADVQAIDPSAGQLDYARTRLPAGAPVTWLEGDAMRLPLPDASRDAATMALVLFFVPEPAVGVAEMCRVVRPGGLVAAYHWDMLEGGFPFSPIWVEAEKRGVPPRLPPSVEAATIENSTALWRQAGLRDVTTCQITVTRTFDRFEDYWNSAATSNTLKPLFDAIPEDQRASMQSDVRRRLDATDGPLTVSARANAIRGIRP